MPVNSAWRGLVCNGMPLTNTMGRSCFGHLYATDTVVDFYTEYFDCPKMHYYKATQEVIAFNFYEEPMRYDTRTFFITKKMPTCPFEVISFLKRIDRPESKDVYSFIAYNSVREYERRSSNPFILNNELNCSGYAVTPNKKEMSLVKPYSKRAKPTPRPKPVQPHGGQLDPL